MIFGFKPDRQPDLPYVVTSGYCSHPGDPTSDPTADPTSHTLFGPLLAQKTPQETRPPTRPPVATNPTSSPTCPRWETLYCPIANRYPCTCPGTCLSRSTGSRITTTLTQTSIPPQLYPRNKNASLTVTVTGWDEILLEKPHKKLHMESDSTTGAIGNFFGL